MPSHGRNVRASALRGKIRRLEAEHASLLDRILQLRNLFAASLSTVYRTCGKPRCACTRGKPHGPYFFLSIQSGGRNDRDHLSPQQVILVQPAIDRYREFQRSCRRLRAIHRTIEENLRRLRKRCETRSVKSFTT